MSTGVAHTCSLRSPIKVVGSFMRLGVVECFVQGEKESREEMISVYFPPVTAQAGYVTSKPYSCESHALPAHILLLDVCTSVVPKAIVLPTQVIVE